MFSWLFSHKPEPRAITAPSLLSLGNYSDSPSIVVTEDTSLQLVTVRSCIDLIARTIATLSVHAYERKEGDRERVDGHPVARLMAQPNPMMTSIDWLESLLNRVLLYGNSYDFIDYEGSRPVAIYPLDNHKVRPIRPNGQLVYEVTISGITRQLEPYQLLHCKGFTKDGVLGISPIEHAARTIASGLSMDRMQQRFFDNGQHMGGVLKHPERLSDQARENLRTQIERQHQGVDRAFRTLILQEGMDYSPLGIPQDQAQFVEQRKLNTLDVLRIFHVPSHMMAVTEGSMSFASVEHMGISFYRNCIRPWVRKLEAELNMKLWLEEEKSRYYIEFDPASLLRGDQKSEDESFRTGSQWGWYSINEIRRKKNLSPVENGDGHYRPLNMTPIEGQQSPPADVVEDRNLSIDRSLDLKPVFRDCLNRVTTKEINAVQRAAKKHSPEDLIIWGKDFFQKHRATVAGTFGPAMTANRQARRIDKFAERHCRTRYRQLRRACECEEPQAALEHLLATWRNNEQAI